MDVAGEHDDVAGTHARGRRGDALAHAFGVDRQRWSCLEDARARRFGHAGEPERIVERMDVKRARQVQGVEIVIGLEHLAHALGRPALDLGPELLAIELDIRQDLVAVVDLGDFEPAGDRCDAGHARLGDRRAHIAQAHLRQVPQRLGVLHADAADHALHRFREAGQDKTVVATGCVPAMRSVSSTTTDHPRRAISRAVVSPARPPPMTQTSTSRSKVSGPRMAVGTMVAVYQEGA